MFFQIDVLPCASAPVFVTWQTAAEMWRELMSFTHTYNTAVTSRLPLREDD